MGESGNAQDGTLGLKEAERVIQQAKQQRLGAFFAGLEELQAKHGCKIIAQPRLLEDGRLGAVWGAMATERPGGGEPPVPATEAPAEAS